MNNNYCPRCDKEFAEGWDWKTHDCYVKTNSVGIIEYNGPMQLNKKDIAMTAINAYIDGWNAAIEAAALKIAGAPMFAEEIRKLKK